MKGLDTPILLKILHGAPEARRLLRTLHGEELATTELNLLELELLSIRGPPILRKKRQAALDRLRGRISILPVDEGAVTAIHGRAAKGVGSLAPAAAAMLGAIAAAGCTEWITSQGFGFGAVPGYKVRFA